MSNPVQRKTTNNDEVERITLPKDGFVRLLTILLHFPVSKATWWNGVKDGRFPPSVSLGPNSTAWKARDIWALIESVNRGETPKPGTWTKKATNGSAA